MPLLRISAGSYERLLFGYVLDTDTGAHEQLFGFGAHVGCIKSAVVSSKAGGTLATGGQDELIKVFSLRTLKSLGELFLHTGTVTCLQAFSATHLVSGDEVGKVVLWRTKDWEALKVLKGHKAAITGIAIHPTGKLALTVSSDRVVICWNLLRGIKATKSKLPESPFGIHFNPSGTHYAVLYNNALIIYDTLSTAAIGAFQSKVRLNAFRFIDDGQIVIGLDDGAVKILRVAPVTTDEDEGDQVTLTVAADLVKPVKTAVVPTIARVRDLAVVTAPSDDAEAQDETYVVAASSDGAITTWACPALRADRDKVETVEPLGTLNTKCRLTCLAVDIVNPELVEEESDDDEDVAEEQAEAADLASDNEDEEAGSDAGSDEDDEPTLPLPQPRKAAAPAVKRTTAPAAPAKKRKQTVPAAEPPAKKKVATTTLEPPAKKKKTPAPGPAAKRGKRRA
ncbi:p21-activated protein kinase-interacting protein 1-like protein [Allomyces arbusculus]|nr:p21-activated protein kinase-interacting protein 1-like protein [Allomyces arbusculus]